jgi:hypothetical protein
VTTADPSEKDAGVFIGLISRYFSVTGGSEPELLPPSLEWQVPPRLDCTGYMPVRGALNGWIAISMPDRMLDGLLDKLGEPQRDVATRLDLTAEMANTITSNARAHFGPRLQLTPPVAGRRDEQGEKFPPPPVSFRLPFRWKGDEGFLLVALQN